MIVHQQVVVVYNKNLVYRQNSSRFRYVSPFCALLDNSGMLYQSDLSLMFRGFELRKQLISTLFKIAVTMPGSDPFSDYILINYDD
jgi:hypothetical protein